jgi:hypothetical protein
MISNQQLKISGIFFLEKKLTIRIVNFRHVFLLDGPAPASVIGVGVGIGVDEYAPTR